MFSFSGWASQMRPVPSTGHEKKYAKRKGAFAFLCHATRVVATSAAPAAHRPTDHWFTGMTAAK